jgi:putative acetyltransferase
MRLRPERPADHDAVRAIHLRAFGEDGHGPVVAGLVEALRADATLSVLSLVAEDPDGQVVAHAMFTPGLLDAPPRLVDIQILSPLAVTPERQRHGLGQALVRHGLHLLADRHVPLVFLEGDPGYYPRLGFTPGGDLGFRKPSLRIPDPAFQVSRLPAYEPWMTGTLVYPPPFWQHDCVGLR